MLFKEGTLSEKMTGIFQLTYEHARNLGLYVFIYKSIVCLLNKIRRRKSKLHNFLAGCIAGYVIFGRKKSSVN
jgi:peroxisomal membrane protein 4